MSAAVERVDRRGQPVVEIRGLWTVFDAPGGQVVIHRDLDLTIQRGEVVSLVGGSGTATPSPTRAKTANPANSGAGMRLTNPSILPRAGGRSTTAAARLR